MYRRLTLLCRVFRYRAVVLMQRLKTRCDTGQATAEYALVLLGAATIALLLLAWATGSGKIGELFDAVFDHLMGQIR